MPKAKPTSAVAASTGDANVDPKAAEKAFQALKSRMLALDPGKLAVQSVDLEKAAIAAGAVGRWVKEKEPRKRFASLPAQHFDQAHVDELEDIALACWHAAVSLRSANAGKTEAKLPVSLVTEATAVRTRKLALVEYNFGDDPVDRAEIDDIKLGTGYADMASDLLRLAKLYAKHADRVKLDPKNYQPGDEAAAGRLAHRIVKELGEAKNQEQKTWTDLAARAWTLLVRVYDEVSQAGLWLFRGEPEAQRFPSLYVVGRAAPVRAANKAVKDGGEPVNPR